LSQWTTLGNMRANGVRTLAAWCLGRGCNRHSILAAIDLIGRLRSSVRPAEPIVFFISRTACAGHPRVRGA
jgi:hypothetical protein